MAEEKLVQKKEEQEKEIRKNNYLNNIMREISQIRKLSLWIFIPLVAINLCLIISQNYNLFENTIFVVDEIGKSNFSIPYIDGSLSISKFQNIPSIFSFKPSMFLTAIFLFFYWKNNNSLINNLRSTKINYKFKTLESCLHFFLVIHSILLGVKFDIQNLQIIKKGCFASIYYF